MDYLFEYLRVLGIYIGFIVGCASVLLVVRYSTRVPDYIFRKLLHFVAVTSILPLAYSTEIWWIAVAVEVFFLIIIIAALHFFESFSFYKGLFVEKAKHEVVVSFVSLFGLMTVMLAVFWGGLRAEHKYSYLGTRFWVPRFFCSCRSLPNMHQILPLPVWSQRRDSSQR